MSQSQPGAARYISSKQDRICRHCPHILSAGDPGTRGLCRKCYRRADLLAIYPPSRVSQPLLPSHGPCRHCGRHCKYKRRQWMLCQPCCNKPEVNALYPTITTGRYKSGYMPDDNKVPPLPDAPVYSQPGSEERILEYQERVAAGRHWQHPDDKKAELS